MAEAESVDTDDGKLARRWISELDTCDRWQRNYLTRCNRIVRRYRNEQWGGLAGSQDVTNAVRRFAILWSNIQTLGPAVYARTPQPVVTRRYKDSDPVGRFASEVLERALSYSMDQYEFDDHIKLARDDYLLLARGTVWVRYVPHKAVDDAREQSPELEIEDDGPSITTVVEEPDQIPYAEVVCDHVAYDDWGMEPCRSWDEAGYVWRRVFMDRKQLVERFGRKIGRAVPLDWSPQNNTQDPSTAVNADQAGWDRVKRAAVYEIWSKEDGEVFWINKSYPQGVLGRKPDWLKLTGFFPCPRPLTGTQPPDSYIPVPDFVYYQDQAEELDELTARIGTLVDGLKILGFYGGEVQANLQTLLSQPSGTMVPIASMANWTDKGGFKGMVDFFPIENLAKTLDQCFEARKRILDDIYQITGLADVIRGESDPRETATAQALKGLWGPLRIRDKQKEIARFCRDVLDIKAQVIAGQFGVQTLKLMTDVKLFDTQAQKMQVQQALQPQQPGAQPLPLPPGANAQELREMAGRPTWEEVNGLLKNSAIRGFRIDVETDSTIEPDETEEKAARVEFVTAIGQLLGASLPFLQSAPQMAPLVGQSVMFLARGFRVGREMEDVIESTFEQLAQNPPKELGQKGGDPAQAQADTQMAQINAQTEQVKQQGAVQVASIKAQQQAQQLPIEQGKLQLERSAQQLQWATLQRDPNPQAVSNG